MCATFPVVASLTEMEPMGCLCFCILQCALGVHNISCCCESDRNGTNGLLVLLYPAVCPRCAQHFLLLRVRPKWNQWVAQCARRCAQHLRVVASLRNGANRLLVLLYSAVYTRCAQHYLVVASLTEMEPVGCLCFCILQCVLRVRRISRHNLRFSLAVASLIDMELMGSVGGL